MIWSKYGCREKGAKLKIICPGPHYPLTYLWRNSLWKWTLMISLFILKEIWHTIDICKCFVMSFLSIQCFHEEPMREKFHHHIWQQPGNPMWVPLNPTNPQRLWNALFSLPFSESGFRQRIYWHASFSIYKELSILQRTRCCSILINFVYYTAHENVIWSMKISRAARVNPSILLPHIFT